MTNRNLLLGIDVGTTSVKGALYTAEGEEIFSRRVPYPTLNPGRPGWVEQDPSEWISAIRQICTEARHHSPNDHIRSLGLTSQANTHLFLDGDGRPLMNAITWQDQRCAEAASRLDGQIPPDLRKRCWGTDFRPDPSFLMSRARWLSDTHPHLWERCRWILLPKDYCLMLMTGAIASDPISSVSLTDSHGDYLTEAFDLIDGLAERLPPLFPVTAPLGDVSPDFLPPGCTASMAPMDAWAALYGSGVSEIGDAFQIAGTSEVMGIVSERRHGGQGVISFPPLSGWVLHAGPTQMGGEAAPWFKNFANLESIEDLFDLAASVGRGQNPLLFLPHVMGERAPLWDPQAKGAFVGLNPGHSYGHLALALLEGVGFAARLLLTELEAAAGLSPQKIRLSGGGARSDLWCQIKADILDRPLDRLRNLDTGTFGAALIGGVGAGLIPSLDEAGRHLVQVERRFEPDAGYREFYGELFGIFQECYESLREVNRRLDGLIA